MAKNKIERIDQEIEKTRNRSDGSCVTHDSSTAERYAFRWNEPRQRYSTVGIK